MKQKIVWVAYAVWNKIFNFYNAVMRKLKINLLIVSKYKKENTFDIKQAGNYIRSAIIEGNPALIARFGSVEAKGMAENIGLKLGIIKKLPKSTLHLMNINAGVFPYGQDTVVKASNIMLDAAAQIDMLGTWDTYMQNYLIRKVCSAYMRVTPLRNLEPYYSDEPWTAALKGKKVLVIHPFKDTIETQYKKRELLFDNPDMLPEFELKVLKSVQTIAGQKDERFADWQEALNYMYEEAMKIDFDVAILGCGAYGMPLAAMLKQSGKVAIHLGGATQLLFGIKGARWDNHPCISRLYNEHWTRPMESEKPEGAQKVEGACYW